MKSKTVAILDIETVKDVSVLGDDLAQDKWPSPIGWKIVAIGLMIVDVSGVGADRRFKARALRCGVGDERECISKFWSFFDQRGPTLVTWNGRRFDVPVLIQRAFYHGIRVPRWFQAGDRFSNYRYRYCSDWHCDLMDWMSDYGAFAPAGMDLIAASVGFPGKIGGHGSEVQDMFEQGDLDRIAAYCECDVLNLYGLFLRWGYTTGDIDLATYDAALDDLSSFLGAEALTKARCGEFLEDGTAIIPVESHAGDLDVQQPQTLPSHLLAPT